MSDFSVVTILTAEAVKFIGEHRSHFIAHFNRCNKCHVDRPLSAEIGIEQCVSFVVMFFFSIVAIKYILRHLQNLENAA
jgi:hypothetical protein